MLWIEHFLISLKDDLKDWSLSSFDANNKMLVKNDSCSFVFEISEVFSSFDISDEDKEMVEYTKRISEIVNNFYSSSTNKIEKLIDILNKNNQILADKLLKIFVTALESAYIYEYQLEYFLEFYIDGKMNDDFYIDDNYILYKTETISYK